MQAHCCLLKMVLLPTPVTRSQTSTTSVPGYECSRAHSQSRFPSRTPTSWFWRSRSQLRKSSKPKVASVLGQARGATPAAAVLRLVCLVSVPDVCVGAPTVARFPSTMKMTRLCASYPGPAIRAACVPAPNVAVRPQHLMHIQALALRYTRTRRGGRGRDSALATPQSIAEPPAQPLEYRNTRARQWI
jgi:hypothetical protein